MPTLSRLAFVNRVAVLAQLGSFVVDGVTLTQFAHSASKVVTNFVFGHIFRVARPTTTHVYCQG